MKVCSDSFTDAEILEAWSAFSKMNQSDGANRPPKLFVCDLRAKFINSHENRRYGRLAVLRPLYCGIRRVSRIFANPSGLNHKVEGFKVNVLRAFRFVRHSLGLSVKHTESGESAPKAAPRAIGPNTKKGVQGAMDCPVCKKGQLRYTRAACNGHIHARCSTEDCVRWME